MATTSWRVLPCPKRSTTPAVIAFMTVGSTVDLIRSLRRSSLRMLGQTYPSWITGWFENQPATLYPHLVLPACQSGLPGCGHCRMLQLLGATGESWVSCGDQWQTSSHPQFTVGLLDPFNTNRRCMMKSRSRSRSIQHKQKREADWNFRNVNVKIPIRIKLQWVLHIQHCVEKNCIEKPEKRAQSSSTL
jgi:hypothetical protein